MADDAPIAGTVVAVSPDTPEDLALSDEVRHWLTERRTYFADALPNHIDSRHFIQVALSCIRSTNALRNCSRESLLIALMSCARLGLDPDGIQAAIVPFGNRAQFIPMYQGYIDLMHRTGMVESIHFDWIHEKDDWDLDRGQRPPNDFRHRPHLLSKNRGPVVLAYAFAWIRNGGRSQVITLNREEAEEIRDNYSRSYERAERKRRQEADAFKRNPKDPKYNSPWHTNFNDMWAKSAVRKLAKRVPTSPELRELIRLDDAADSRFTGKPDDGEAKPTALQAAWENAQAKETADPPTGEQSDAGTDEPAPIGVDIQRMWLRQEIRCMAAIMEWPETKVIDQVQKRLAGPLDDAHPATVITVLGPFREGVVKALRELAQDEAADRYMQAGPGTIASPRDLFGELADELLTGADDDARVGGQE